MGRSHEFAEHMHLGAIFCNSHKDNPILYKDMYMHLQIEKARYIDNIPYTEKSGSI